MRCLPSTVALFALVAIAADVAAQRRPMLGRVVDEHGEPVADAVVHAVYVPLGAERSAAADQPQTTTDKRGRFRLRVLPCTRYRLWAIGAADDDGARMVSEIVWASAGQIVELQATHARPPCTLTVTGTEAFEDYAPLSLRLVPGGAEVDDMVVPIDEHGKALLPPLPAGRVSCDILDQHGEPLMSLSIKAGKNEIAMHAKQTVPMLVVDRKGRPVAGATIHQRLNGGWVTSNGFGNSPPPRKLWRRLGETDADGKFVAPICHRYKPFENTNWQQLFFLAEKPGLASSHSGFTDNPFIDGKEVDREGMTELRFTLGKQKPLTGRVMLDAERGLAGQRVTVRVVVKVENKGNRGWTHEHLVRHVLTGHDGTFTIPDLPASGYEMQVLLDGKELRKLVPESLLRMTPAQAVALHRIYERPTKELRIDAGGLRTLQLQLLDETGGPASGAEIMLISREKANQGTCDNWTPSVTTDSAGRTAMLLQPGKWLLFARNQSGMCHQNLDIDGDVKLDLRLQEMPTMRGRVIDGDGKPLANATMNCHRSTWRNGGDRDEGLAAIAGSLNWNWIGSTRTDADGNFACRYLELPGMTYGARFRHKKKKSPDFQIEANDEPITIVIE